MKDDERYMRMALDLAAKGRGHTSPNPMVGAVVVNGGEVVGRGYHRAAGTPHAEVHAIDDAGPLAKGATLYVTLEPCNHTGRTPPCTQKILDAHIRRVVVAMKDPNPHVTGNGIGRLESHDVAVTMGVLQAEAERLNEIFVKHIQTGRPFVIAKCASTLDGRIATRSGDSKWVTGSLARQYVHEVRHAVDAILVGIETVKKDDPSLTARLKDGFGKDPVRVVLDTHFSMPEDAKMLSLDSDAETIIVTGDLSGTSGGLKKKDRLEKGKVRVLQAPVRENRIDMAQLPELLQGLGITSLLIEGGGRVMASAFSAGIVDKVLFFYAPKILGGSDGVPICSGPGPQLMRDAIPVRRVSVHRLGEDILVEGYVGPPAE